MPRQKQAPTEIKNAYFNLDESGEAATLVVTTKDGQHFGFEMSREVLDRLRMEIDAAVRRRTLRDGIS